MKNKYTYSFIATLISSVVLAGDFGSAAQEVNYVTSSSSSQILNTLDVAGFYDDNIHAGTEIRDQESFVLQGALNSKLSTIRGGVVSDYFTRIGGRYNEDSDDNFDSFEWDLAAGLNRIENINARNAISSAVNLSYVLDDEAAFGNTNTRGGEEYLAYSVDNSLSTQWTETLQSIVGLTISGTDFDASSTNDRFNVELNARISERLSNLLRAYVNYSYRQIFADDTDSSIHRWTVGGDYEISAVESLNAEVGVQFRDIDNGDSNQNLYLSVTFNRELTELLDFKFTTTYGADEQGNLLAGTRFEEKISWRNKAGLSYDWSQKIKLTSEVDYLFGDYSDPQSGSAPEGDEERLTWSTGATYTYSPTMRFNATYSYVNSNSDVATVNVFERNRFSLGANIDF